MEKVTSAAQGYGVKLLGPPPGLAEEASPT
jgi:hypothetical protein